MTEDLPALRTSVVELRNKADLRGELRVSPPWIKSFFLVVRWAVGAFPRGLRECGDFIQSVAETDSCALEAFDQEVGSCCVGTF